MLRLEQCSAGACAMFAIAGAALVCLLTFGGGETRSICRYESGSNIVKRGNNVQLVLMGALCTRAGRGHLRANTTARLTDLINNNIRKRVRTSFAPTEPQTFAELLALVDSIASGNGQVYGGASGLYDGDIADLSAVRRLPSCGIHLSSLAPLAAAVGAQKS